MSATEDFATAREPFAVFRGEIDAERAVRLFRQRKLSNRLVALFGLVLFFGLVAAGYFAFVPLQDRWAPYDVYVAIAMGIWLVWVMIRFDSAFQRGRDWQHNNRLLSGRYEVVLTDRHLDIRHGQLAQRIPYWNLTRGVETESTFLCLNLSAMPVRSLLLPMEDCTPSRTTDAVSSFLSERILETRGTESQPPQAVSKVGAPLPFEFATRRDRITVGGTLSDDSRLRVLTGESATYSKAQFDQSLKWMMGLLAVLIVTGLPLALFQGGQAIGLFVLVVSVAAFFILLILMPLWLNSARFPVKIEPIIPQPELSGWVSDEGMSACTEYGCLAVKWSACDTVEINDKQIVIKLLGGQIEFGRPMFGSDAASDRCLEWIRLVGAKG